MKQNWIQQSTAPTNGDIKLILELLDWEVHAEFPIAFYRQYVVQWPLIQNIHQDTIFWKFSLLMRRVKYTCSMSDCPTVVKSLQIWKQIDFHTENESLMIK